MKRTYPIIGVFALSAATISLSPIGTGSPYAKDDPARHNISKAVSDNLKVDGVPIAFTKLMASYIKFVSNDVPHPEYDAHARAEAAKILKTIQTVYNNKAEEYWVAIAKTNRSPRLRVCAYNLFLKSDLNDGHMLAFARKELKERNWSDGQHLSSDIGHQMRVIVAYGDESDLRLWDDIWSKMGEHERHAFKVYRKMLTKALDNENKITRARAARGDKAAEQELLGKNSEELDEEESVFYDKRFLIGGLVILISLVIYTGRCFRNKRQV